MNAFGLKNLALGAACAGLLFAGPHAAMAQSVAPSAKAPAVNCDAKGQRGKLACATAARSTAPLGSDVSYQSANARPVGSIVIPLVAAAAAIGLAVALASSGGGRGPVVVVSP